MPFCKSFIRACRKANDLFILNNITIIRLILAFNCILLEAFRQVVSRFVSLYRLTKIFTI